MATEIGKVLYYSVLVLSSLYGHLKQERESSYLEAPVGH